MDPSVHPMDLVNNSGGVPSMIAIPSTDGHRGINTDLQALGAEIELSTPLAEVAQCTIAQQENTQDGGFTLVKRKIARREPASTPSLAKTVYPEYTINELRSMTACNCQSS